MLTFARTMELFNIKDCDREALDKIVNVLLSLHQKVASLSRSKPELLKEIESLGEGMDKINE